MKSPIDRVIPIWCYCSEFWKTCWNQIVIYRSTAKPFYVVRFNRNPVHSHRIKIDFQFSCLFFREKVCAFKMFNAIAFVQLMNFTMCITVNCPASWLLSQSKSLHCIISDVKYLWDKRNPNHILHWFILYSCSFIWSTHVNHIRWAFVTKQNDGS